MAMKQTTLAVLTAALIATSAGFAFAQSGQRGRRYRIWRCGNERRPIVEPVCDAGHAHEPRHRLKRRHKHEQSVAEQQPQRRQEWAALRIGRRRRLDRLDQQHRNDEQQSASQHHHRIGLDQRQPERHRQFVGRPWRRRDRQRFTGC